LKNHLIKAWKVKTGNIYVLFLKYKTTKKFAFVLFYICVFDKIKQHKQRENVE